MGGVASVIKNGTLTPSQYTTLHHWVGRMLGTPNCCSNCGSRDKSRYAWANISGKYLKDVNDWVRLCYSCHMFRDAYKNWKNEYCKNGHRMVISNLYLYRKDNNLTCRACRSEERRIAYRKKRLAPTAPNNKEAV